MLQKLTYFYCKKTHVFFFRFSFCATLFFPLMNAPVYVDIDQGTHYGKNKIAQNEKSKKYVGFLMIKIWQILKDFARSFHQA